MCAALLQFVIWLMELCWTGLNGVKEEGRRVLDCVLSTFGVNNVIWCCGAERSKVSWKIPFILLCYLEEFEETLNISWCQQVGLFGWLTFAISHPDADMIACYLMLSDAIHHLNLIESNRVSQLTLDTLTRKDQRLSFDRWPVAGTLPLQLISRWSQRSFLKIDHHDSINQK